MSVRTSYPVAEMEDGHDCAAAEQRSETGGAMHAEQVKGLRQSRVARLPGRREAWRLGSCPVVIGVAAAEQSDQKAGVNQNASGHNVSP